MLIHINLQLGWPTPRLFPAEKLATATTTSLLDPEIAKAALVYGPDLGYLPLRSSIASWLSDFYQPPSGQIGVERIAITGGASQNLASILHVFSDPAITRRVWMVEPVYFLACAIFQDAGFTGKMRGVVENNHGIDVHFLREELESFEKQDKEKPPPTASKSQPQYEKIYRHVLYCTPTFSNPSAKTMSREVREQLLALAREFDMLIISDDCYDWLRWPIDGEADQNLAAIPPRIVDLDRASASADGWGNSISNGSFSKIVAPGVRVGWAEGSEKAILRLSQKLTHCNSGSTRSGGAPSQLTSTFIHQLLSTGALQSHIDNVLIPTYRQRYLVLMSSITKHLLPLGVRITIGEPYVEATPETGVVPAGGFFTYIAFPAELPSADVIAKRALNEYNLRFAYGEMFVVKGDDESTLRAKLTWGNGARLCWAWEEEEMIMEGIKRLTELLKIMLKEARDVETH
ncbi:MAG: hypothetical protein M1818_003905 [Claussenomyces sp. TS43310]|nr:MAG: hypothetical protein M1818_003905 [Claussenomyces sp. TS43310]